jgi:hypothetical protein
VQTIAERIVNYAQSCMKNKKRVSPFERAAAREGMYFRGGVSDMSYVGVLFTKVLSYPQKIDEWVAAFYFCMINSYACLQRNCHCGDGAGDSIACPLRSLANHLWYAALAPQIASLVHNHPASSTYACHSGYPTSHIIRILTITCAH